MNADKDKIKQLIKLLIEPAECSLEKIIMYVGKSNGSQFGDYVCSFSGGLKISPRVGVTYNEAVCNAIFSLNLFNFIHRRNCRIDRIILTGKGSDGFLIIDWDGDTSCKIETNPCYLEYRLTDGYKRIIHYNDINEAKKEADSIAKRYDIPIDSISLVTK